MTAAVVLNKTSATEATLHVYGVIGSEVTAQDVATALKDAAGVKTLRVFVDSPGGDLMAGKAIYAQLSRFAQASHVVAQVDGLAASAASFLIMAASRIVMAPEATMMVHQANAVAGGRAADFRKMADILEAENANLVAIYSKRTGKSADEIAALLEAETWMNAEEAVAAKFADEILAEPKPRPRAESAVVMTAQARVEDVERRQRLSVQWAEVERIRSKLSNAASRGGAPGQPGTPEVQPQSAKE
jgi:ATP-dependent protease ClpP protease subunit